MRLNQSIRLIFMLIFMISGIIMLETIRKNHKTTSYKKLDTTNGRSQFSNTDYIFFESISKYLFTSLIN